VARWRQAEDWRLVALAAVGLLLAVCGWRILAAHLRRSDGRTTMGDLERVGGVQFRVVEGHTPRVREPMIRNFRTGRGSC
jgi:hypothetical protein